MPAEDQSVLICAPELMIAEEPLAAQNGGTALLPAKDSYHGL